MYVDILQSAVRSVTLQKCIIIISDSLQLRTSLRPQRPINCYRDRKRKLEQL